MMVYARGSSQCNPLVMGLTSQSLHLGVYILKPSPCQVFFALSSFLQLSFCFRNAGKRNLCVMRKTDRSFSRTNCKCFGRVRSPAVLKQKSMHARGKITAVPPETVQHLA